MTIINSRVLIRLEESWQYCHYNRNQVPWVFGEQVVDKGSIWAF